MSKMQTTIIPPEQWEWYGHAAHFICGRWCRFHMATKVGKYLVSTVGQYVHPSRSKGSEADEAKWLRDNPNGEEIGCDRFYETMVFLAGQPCQLEGCNCGLPAIRGHELDTGCYQTGGEARTGHMELCRKWAQQQETRNANQRRTTRGRTNVPRRPVVRSLAWRR